MLFQVVIIVLDNCGLTYGDDMLQSEPMLTSRIPSVKVLSKALYCIGIISLFEAAVQTILFQKIEYAI